MFFCLFRTKHTHTKIQLILVPQGQQRNATQHNMLRNKRTNNVRVPQQDPHHHNKHQKAGADDTSREQIIRQFSPKQSNNSERERSTQNIMADGVAPDCTDVMTLNAGRAKGKQRTQPPSGPDESE